MNRDHANAPPGRKASRKSAMSLAGQRGRGRRALAPGLHLVATPIGNLRDITLRALEALAGADLIACEDTRVTRKLLDHYGIATPLTPYHDHNAAEARPKLLRRLADGAAIALVSDAGTPLISDPGYKLVRAAREAGHAVTAVPGASALLAALAVAGLPTDRFFFEGFLPPKQAARRTRIAELARIPATLVLFETGPRLGATLADLAAGLGPREAAVCRELTKLHEEVRARRSARRLRGQRMPSAEPRGEIVLVIAPPAAAERPTPSDIDALLRAALARASLKDAVGEVAAATGVPRREVYQRALALGERGDDGAAMTRRSSRADAPRRGPSAWPRSGSACRRRAAPPPILIAKGYRIVARRFRSAGRRDRHRGAAAARAGVRRGQGARRGSTTRPKSVTERQQAPHRRRRRGLARRASRRRASRHPLRRDAGRAGPHAAPHPGGVRRRVR